MPRALFSLENPQQELLQGSVGPFKDEIDAVFERRPWQCPRQPIPCDKAHLEFTFQKMCLLRVTLHVLKY